MIYGTSDWHLFHKNIGRYEPTRQDREIPKLVRHWREIVKPEDTVWFLGDLMLASSWHKQYTEAIMLQLPGHKKFVYGNHDEGKSESFLARCGFEEIYPLFAPLRTFDSNGHEAWCLLTHYPIRPDSRHDDKYKDITDKLMYEFNDRAYHFNIHGHTHSTVMSDPRCITVCTEPNDFKIVNLHEAIAQRRQDIRNGTSKQAPPATTLGS